MPQLSLTERESLVVEYVTRSFVGMNLDVVRLTWPGPKGGSEILRFTVNDAFSTDLSPDQIDGSGRDPEDIARQIENDLRGQMGDSGGDH